MRITVNCCFQFLLSAEVLLDWTNDFLSFTCFFAASSRHQEGSTR